MGFTTRVCVALPHFSARLLTHFNLTDFHPKPTAMTQRDQIRLRIVHLQQRLLQQRRVWLSHEGNPQRLRAVREQNHAALKVCLAEVLADPSVRQAADFFFEHLYPLSEPAWRDEQFFRTAPRMCRVMPVAACEVLEQAVLLDLMTFELDLAHAQGQGPSLDTLAQARQQQLQAVVTLGAGLAKVARVPLMAWLLKCAGPVARRKGLSELHGFFSAGLDAFLGLHHPEMTLQRIQTLGDRGIAVRQNAV